MRNCKKISQNPRYCNGEKMLSDPHLDPDQHQNLTTAKVSPLDNAYHVW